MATRPFVSRWRSGRLERHLAAAAVVAAGVVGAADAAIVTWNLNRAIPATIDGLYVKVDTQEFTSLAGANLPGWDINPYGASSLIFYASASAPNPATTYVRTQASGGPSNLAPGTVVGASSPFANGTTAVISSSNIGANGWTLNAVNYVGFRFRNDTTGAINFGYGAVQVGATAASRTLLFITYGNAGESVVVTPQGGAPDADGDGVADATDNCPSVPNPTQADADADGFGDACDACPAQPGPSAGCPPPGDECTTALPAQLGVNSVNTATMTASPDPPADGSCQYLDWNNSRDAWFSFDAGAAGGRLSVDLCASNWDTSLVIYQGGCGALTRVACDDDSCNPAGPLYQSRISSVNVSGTVLIRIGGYGGTTGNAIMNLAFTSNSDADLDGVEDAVDNCPSAPNPTQADADADGIGDACDLCPGESGPAACGGCACPESDAVPLSCNGGSVSVDSVDYLPPATSAVVVTAWADADVADGGSSEFVRVFVEGTALPDISGADCGLQSRSVTVPAATFNAWIADGVLQATAQTGPDTDCFCANIAYLRLAYVPDCSGDLDGDGQNDCADADDDGDGVPDADDFFPRDPSEYDDADDDGIGDNADLDDDNDGVADTADNCDLTPNPGQDDADADGDGDACDPDDDNDGVLDGADNCRFAANPDQANADLDSFGDACDVDDDNDGVLDDDDDCPLVANPAQADTDGDGQGDACDDDDDGDGLPDVADNCRTVPNPGQDDCDADGEGDACEYRARPGAVQWRVQDGGNGHWYRLSDEAMSWPQAKAFAEAAGGHLVTLTSAVERDFVRAMAQCNSVHVGLFQPADACEPGCGWAWVTGEELEYAPWNPGEPNDSFSEDAAEMICSGAWNDISEFAPRRFVIEWPTGASADCDANGLPDDCDITADPAIDCDGNGSIDACELADGSGIDADADGILDFCEDGDGDGVANGRDRCPLLAGDAGCGGCPAEVCEASVPVEFSSPVFPLLCNGGTSAQSIAAGQGLVPALGDVTVYVYADADTDALDEFVRISVEGTQAPEISGFQCSPDVRQFTVPAATFNAWIADGAVSVTAVTGPETDCFCANTWFVSFEYLGSGLPPAGSDRDGDGVPIEQDLCPTVTGGKGCADGCPLNACGLCGSEGLGVDTDGDGTDDCFDDDDDGDGVPDAKDAFPLDPAESVDTDGDGTGNNADADDDGDAAEDGADNCPLVANANQLDTDGDGEGDACDADDDGDGLADGSDNCPLTANADQADCDGDGIGDACAILGGQPRPVSYDMPNGTTGSYVYHDSSYNGSGNPNEDSSPLSGGLGELTDGIVAPGNWYSTPGPYVGWGSVTPTITFRFAAARAFGAVTFHLDDANGYGCVAPPSVIRIAVGTGAPVDFPVTDPASGAPFAFTADLAGRVGDRVEVTLLDGEAGGCVFLSEVVFEGGQADCNSNGLPDNCDIAADPSLDCDANGAIDACEIAAGAPDTDGDGLLDRCEDDDGDGVVNRLDHCPELPGAATCAGCPQEVCDTYGGVPGPASDNDADGVPLSQDRCPTELGAPGCLGCPAASCALPRPDLVISGLSVPTPAYPGSTVTVAWTATNAGTVATDAPWYERLEIRDAADAVVGATDYWSEGMGGGLAAGESRGRSFSFTAPGLSGPYRAVLVADFDNRLSEGPGETNNASDAVDVRFDAADLFARNAALPATAAVNDPVSVSWEVANEGEGRASGCFHTSVWLSADDSLSADDALVAEPFNCYSSVPAGGFVAQQAALGLGPVVPGTYRVFVVVDRYGQVFESDESNNTLDAGTIILGPPEYPDLAVVAVSSPATVSVGAPLPVSWTVANAGTRTAATAFWDRLELVDSADGSGPATNLGDQFNPGNLAPGASAAAGRTVTVPPPAGTRFLRVTTDVYGGVDEGGAESNNALVGDPVTVLAADLEPSAGSAPSSAEQLVPFTVSWTSSNAGPGDSWGGCAVDRVFISADGVPDASDVSLGQVFRCESPWASGAAFASSLQVSVPESVAPGSYRLLVAVDADGARYEADEADNVLDLGPIAVTAVTAADLVASDVAVSAPAYIGEPFTVSWTVTNAGKDPAPPWVDFILSSADAAAGGDPVIAVVGASAGLAPGESRRVSHAVTASGTPTQRWLYVQTDAYNQVFEHTGEGNNVSALFGPVDFSYRPAADLVISLLAAPASATATEPVQLTYAVRNDGAQPLPAGALWRETVSLSADDEAGGDVEVASFWRLGPLAVGEEQVRTAGILVPLSQVGSRRFVVRVDADNSIDEEDPAREANNVAVASVPTDVVDPALPDLVVTAVTAPASAVESQPFAVSWTGSNAGTAPAAGGWTDRVYLSADAVLDGGDQLVATRFQGTTVAAGGSWSGSVAFAAPAGPASAFVIVVADAGDGVEEGQGDSNNARAADAPTALAPAPRPDLVPAVIGTPPSWQAGQSVQVSWRVTNSGQAATSGGWSDALYLSADAVLSPDDVLLRQQPIAATVPVGGSYERAVAVPLPEDYQGGQRHLLVRTGINAAFPQADAGNDVAAFGPFELLPIPAADLVVQGFAVQGASLTFGQQAQLSWTVRNQGDVAVTGAFSDIVLISSDAVADGDDLPVALVPSAGATLAPGATLARSASPTLPVSNALPAGQYWFIARTDANSNVTESQEGNNGAVIGPFQVQRPPLPDLQASVVAAPSDVAPGVPFDVTVEFRNAGAVALSASCFTSLTMVDGAGERLLQDFAVTLNLEPGASSTLVRSVTIPVPVANSVALKTCADSRDVIVEAVEANCSVSAPVAIRRPDLAVTSVSAPANATGGSPMSVTWTVENRGNAPAQGFWSEVVELSTDAAAGADRLVASVAVTSPLAAGASVTRSTTFTVPPDAEGPLYAVVRADAASTVAELDDSNNAAAAPAATQVAAPPRPNLVVSAVSVPSSALAGGTAQVTYTVLNDSDVPAEGGWVDTVRLSANDVLGQDDPVVGSGEGGAPLAPRASYSRTVSFPVPAVPGSYRVFVVADGQRGLAEAGQAGEADNARMAPGVLGVSGVSVALTAAVESAQVGDVIELAGRATVAGTDQPAPGVRVRVRMSVRGFETDETAVSGGNGSFTVSRPTLPGIGGIYRFSAGIVGAGLAQRDAVAVWGLDAAFDRSQVRLPEGGIVEGVATVRNLSDQPTTGLAVQAAAGDPGTGFEIIDQGGAILGPLESRTVRWRVSATPSSVANLLTLTASSDQAQAANAYSQTLVVPNVATLVATPSPIDVEMQVGEATFVPVRIRNEGTDATGPLSVQVASVPWLQLVTPSSLPPLDPGAEIVVNLRLSPGTDLPLGPYSAIGAVVVRDTTDPTVGVAVNGRFEATSDALSSLTVRARSELSYYFPEGGSPSYPGATVEVRRKDDDSVVASGLVDALGEFAVSKLEPGVHRVRVTAPQHGDFVTEIDLRPGGNDILAFMPRQLVSVEWTVVQVPFSDEYVITVSLTYETNVPVPVITIDPIVLDFASMTAPTKYVELEISNRGGLIAARNFRWTLAGSPRYEVIPLYQSIGDIPAGATIRAPVLMVDHGFGGAASGYAGGSADDCVAPALRGNWQLDCDGLRDFALDVGMVVNACPGTGGGGGGGSTPPIFGGGGGVGGGGGGGFGGGGPGGVSGPPVVVTQQGCNPCPPPACLSALANQGADALLDALLDATGLGEAAAVVGCFQSSYGVASSSNPLANAGGIVGGCFGSFIPGYDSFCDINEILNACSCAPPGGGSGLGRMADFACGQGEFGTDLAAGADPWEIADSVDSADPQYRAALTAATDILRLYRPVAYPLGRAAIFLEATPEDRPRLEAIMAAIASAIAADGPEGVRITAAEAAAIAALPRPAGWGADHLSGFAARWNRTVEYWGLGWFDAADVPAGFDLDFVERSRWQAFAADGGAVLERQALAGYSHPLGQMADAFGAWRSAAGPGQGACVQVRIELDQTVSLVRQAFEATLKLTNGTSAPVEAIDVDIAIKDAAGNDARSRFAVLGPAVTGMGNVDGTGSLPVGSQGVSTWTLVPGDSAAPSGPTLYRVSGNLRYAVGGDVVQIPLYPVAITVYPNASLSMQYFIETQVYGDDPFTPEAEPSIPFSLGLWAKNNGGGTAGQVRIESAQPRVVENETDALIDFRLIGSEVNGAGVTPSLDVSMGDIPPGEVAVARWLMTCSLQGRFVEYSATVRSTNGFDTPEFAVVDEAAVNALTHVVRADVPFDDGRPDFLGNLIADADELPDRVFLSSGTSEPVASELGASVTVSGGTATVTAVPAAGWRYIRVDDPFGGARAVAAVRRSDGKTLRLGDNAWQTSYVSRDGPVPQARRHVHLFDRGGDGIYSVEFAADSTPPRVESWALLREHGGNEVPVNVLPGREQGDTLMQPLERIVLSFSEPIDPASAAAAVAVTGYRINGTVSPLSFTATLGLRTGNQYADVAFSPPLPAGLRYCIRLVGLRDVSGQQLDAASGRIDLTLQPGDVTGDNRVTVNDAGALVTLLGTESIDPLDPYQVRCDIDGDGSITQLDLAVLVGQIGRNWTGFSTPCTSAGPSGPGNSPQVAGTSGDGKAATGGAPMGGAAGGAAAVTAGGGTGRGRGAGASAGDGGPAGAGAPSLILAVSGGTPETAALRADLVAIERGVDPEALAEFALERLVPGCDPCAWEIHAADGHPISLSAARTLQLMLEGMGLRTASVAQRADGSLVLLLPQLDLVARDGIPAGWVDRAVAAALEGAAPHAVADGAQPRSRTVTLRSATLEDLVEAMRRLSSRREFESVRIRTEDVRPAPPEEEEETP